MAETSTLVGDVGGDSVRTSGVVAAGLVLGGEVVIDGGVELALVIFRCAAGVVDTKPAVGNTVELLTLGVVGCVGKE